MQACSVLTICAVLLLTSCISAPPPDEMRRLAEKNRWELAHWGNRPVPYGDDGEPVILTFKDGRVSGHAGCNRYSAAIVFGPHAGEVKVSNGITTRMACEPRHMEFEASFIQAFEASTVKACHSKATAPRGWSFIAVRWTSEVFSVNAIIAFGFPLAVLLGGDR